MSTTTNAHTANIATFLAPLEGTDAARLFHEADLGAWDWYYLTEPVEDILWSLCEVLRHYESPDWGNTSGRYGHTGGHLDIDAVLSMTEDDVDFGRDDADSPLGDFAEPYAVWTFARWADEHGPAALVTLADRAHEVLPSDEDDA